MSSGATPALPSFFADFAVSRGKLALARLAIFGVLAVDAVLQLRHAPRYGAGFNVAHVPGLDALAPGRVGFAVAQVVLALALAAIAVGVGSRLLVGVTAATYAWVYLSSQLDSYQHHYLVMLFLLVSTAVPWFRADAQAPSTAPAGPEPAWAVRLILLQLAIMYAWAAVAKLEGPWLDGSTVARQIAPGLARDGLEWIGVARGAKLIVLIELVLAVTVAVPRLWPVALPVGIGLHVGIILSGLEIGVFAWLMLAMYLLVVPERWMAPALTAARRVGAAWPAASAPALRWLGLAGALAAVVIVGLVVDVPGALAGALVGVVLVVGTDLARQRPRRPRLATGLAPLLAAGLIAYLARSHDVVSDYYRFWGGSARRLGDRASALHAYQRLTEVDPTNPGGYYQRGRLLAQAGAGQDPAAAEAALRRAAALEPTKARALVELARQLARAGRPTEARVALAEARQREPAHPELAAVERALASAGGAGAPDGAEPGPDGSP